MGAASSLGCRAAELCTSQNPVTPAHHPAHPPAHSPDVKGAAPHVKHKHRVAVGAAVYAVGKSRRHRLLQQLHLAQARLLRRRVGGRQLGLAEVGRHGDDLQPASQPAGSVSGSSGSGMRRHTKTQALHASHTATSRQSRQSKQCSGAPRPPPPRLAPARPCAAGAAAPRPTAPRGPACRPGRGCITTTGCRCR